MPGSCCRRWRAIMKAIDLFAGAGGFSTGAAMAGCEVAWAANHWPEAVRWHAANHPDAEHVCQDLHQARWEDVPAHDLMHINRVTVSAPLLQAELVDTL